MEIYSSLKPNHHKSDQVKLVQIPDTLWISSSGFHLKDDRTDWLSQCVSRILVSLTWLQFVICRLKLIFTTAPAALKNGARYTSGQNWLKNNHLTSSLTHSVVGSTCFVSLHVAIVDFYVCIYWFNNLNELQGIFAHECCISITDWINLNSKTIWYMKICK